MLKLIEILDCDPNGFTSVFDQPLCEEYGIGPHPFSENDSREFYAQKLARWINREEFLYAVEESGHIAGVVSLHSIHWNHKCAQLFYWFGETHRGKGLATSAIIQLVHLSFQNYGLNRVEALLRTDNIASRRLLERIEFKQEALLRDKFLSNDRPYDGFQYRLLRTEYETSWKQQFAR